MIQVKSKEEPLEWANPCPLPEGGLMEIRQVFENCDFPPELQKKTADPLVSGYSQRRCVHFMMFLPKLKHGPMEKRVVNRPSFRRSLNRWS